MTSVQTLHTKTVHTLDLNFMGVPGTIAAYLIPHSRGAVLIESGPGSTIPALLDGLKTYHLTERDITDVFLTHIHLDHAGAAGWLARQGARIYVHPVGAPHLLNPEKLLSSAARIYGDMMEQLWGEFLPVPQDRLFVVRDEDIVEVENLRIRALDTPGHANHHLAYLFEDICFTGDIGGVRLTNLRYLQLPMPPPEFHLDQWRASVKKIQQAYAKRSFQRIAPTHFGIFEDPDWHLAAVANALDEIEGWMQAIMPSDPEIENLTQAFVSWTHSNSINQGLNEDQINAYETANPSWMSSSGIYRYWHKYRIDE